MHYFLFDVAIEYENRCQFEWVLIIFVNPAKKKNKCAQSYVELLTTFCIMICNLSITIIKQHGGQDSLLRN